MARIAGRYELHEKLGEGGMGVVWRATDTKTGAAVAIKMIRDVSDPHAIELFTKEWGSLAKLSHPNIVEVRDVDVFEENKQKKPFFVMPLLSGNTLGELISHASSKLTVTRVVEIITQVCKGLQVAHQRGLIHRDLKPSNIFVMDDDTAKIIDFGVVSLAGSKSSTSQKGTWQYMSPEQAQLRDLTPASDLFSLGIVLYEALTLRKPFARATPEETIQAVCKYIPPPVSEINPSVNQLISKVIHKCLAKQPVHRFSSARELADVLVRACRNEAIFDVSKIQPRIERARTAFKAGDEGFASEILGELEAEGHLEPQITVLRTQIDVAALTKKIRHLLESARARMEQDEIPLALEKIREILELDPGNADALAMRKAMEKQRSERQISNWLDLAYTHLGNHDFTAARHAAQEVLAIRRDEPRALEMLEKIDSIAEEANRVRAQKEQLYGSALRAYQNDEIDTAIGKLERLFSVAVSHPNAAVPERDAVYQNFYNELRSERDGIQATLEEAQRQLTEKNFAEALRLCKEGLGKHPNNGAFHALKIQVEDAERQHRSAYIAEISHRAESEFDLDRRADILREAATLYPDEVHFAQQLKMVSERRDLVNSIVGKARQYEERRQFAEALSQWDILRNIHPQYPGIAFELERCRKERNRQVHEEDKARAIEDIERSMESRAYARAIECAQISLQEFPGDEEILGLQQLAEQGLERLKQARALMDSGREAFEEKRFPDAAQVLREAYNLDARAPGVREMFVAILTEWAQSRLDSDWREAESICEEIKKLDPSNSALRVLTLNVGEARRQSAVARCLTDARSRLAAGDSNGALELVRAARVDFPYDARLEQFENSLARDRNKPRVALPQQIETDPEAANASSDVWAHEYQATRPDAMAAAAQPAKEKHYSAEANALSDHPGTDSTRQRDWNLRPRIAEVFGLLRASILRVFANPARAYGGSALLLVVAVAAGYYIFRPAPPTVHPQVPVRSATQVHLVVTPSDALIKQNSTVVSGDTSFGPNSTVEISRPGYKTKLIQLTDAPQQLIALEPEPLRLSIQAADEIMTVNLDGTQVATIQGSTAPPFEIAADGNTHELILTVPGKPASRLQFEALPATAPIVRSLPAARMFAVASFGSDATLYGNSLLSHLSAGGSPVSHASPTGIALPALSEQNHDLKYKFANEEGRLTLDVAPVPALILHPLRSGEQVLITSNTTSAVLTVNGETVPPDSSGWLVVRPPGNYQFVLSAPGYQVQSWTMGIAPHQQLHRYVPLTPIAAKPTVSALVIANGTPSADVLLDGTLVGQLDSTGSAHFPAVAASGNHTLLLQKAGYESRTISFAAQPPADIYLADNNVRLTQFGLMTFSSPHVVSLTYHRNGEPAKSATSSAKLHLPAGTYEILVSGSTFTLQATVGSGQTVTVNISLPLTPADFEEPASVRSDGDWLRITDPANFVFLHPALVNLDIVFVRPASTVFVHKKVEWQFVSADDTFHLVYELENQKLTRRILAGGALIEHRAANVKAISPAQNTSFSLHLRLDGSRLTVSNDSGQTLDQYVYTGHDLVRGKVGIRTPAQFVVRSGR